MFVSKLSLKDYRNHSNLLYDFQPSLNLITGENAAGKTNVVEAIYYLSLARSFRTVEDEEVIRNGCDFAEIKAEVYQGDIKRKINIIITKEGKKIFINGKNVPKLSDLSKCVNVIVFQPEDVSLFKGTPHVRRNFLDISLSKKSQPYLDYISRYNKVLKERNEILKQDKIDQVLLESTTEMLIKLSGPIINYRAQYVKDINDILNKITRALTGTHEKFKINYKPFLEINKDFETNAKEAFKKALDNDLKRKATTIGIHREDFSMSLNDRDIGVFGSQGENRIAALALKLSPYFLIEDKDKRPIIVLDDAMSELDPIHRQRLLEFVKKFEQVFITATDLKVDGASHYQIKKN